MNFVPGNHVRIKDTAVGNTQTDTRITGRVFNTRVDCTAVANQLVLVEWADNSRTWETDLNLDNLSYLTKKVPED